MFKFAGMELPYLKHVYNNTDKNMRTVEVPIINELVRRFDESGQRRLTHQLEIGNVLSHYYYTYTHMTVVDRYEKRYNRTAAVYVQEDFMEYYPAGLFDLIVSISTIEHISHGKYVKDSTKIWQPYEIISHIRELLWPKGIAYVTVPVRYNARLDKYLLEGHIGANLMGCMHRISDENEWEECSLAQAFETDKHRPPGYAWSTGMVVLRINEEQ